MTGSSTKARARRPSAGCVSTTSRTRGPGCGGGCSRSSTGGAVAGTEPTRSTSTTRARSPASTPTPTTTARRSAASWVVREGDQAIAKLLLLRVGRRGPGADGHGVEHPAEHGARLSQVRLAQLRSQLVGPPALGLLDLRQHLPPARGEVEELGAEVLGVVPVLGQPLLVQQVRHPLDALAGE